MFSLVASKVFPTVISGVDTAENIIKAAMEGTNMERDFAAFATALAVVSLLQNFIDLYRLIPLSLLAY